MSDCAGSPVIAPGGRREGLATKSNQYNGLRRILKAIRQSHDFVDRRDAKIATNRICRALADTGMAIAMVALAGAVLPHAAIGATAPQTVSAPAEKPLPPKVKTMGRIRAQGVLGQPVLDAKGQTIGHVVDILIDPEGQPQAAVIEFAGFLGLGDRDVAVDWKALRFAVQKDQIEIRVALEPAALKAMPLYKPAAKSVPVATSAGRASAATGAASVR